jgi:MSHA biogenesis protein MshJ
VKVDAMTLRERVIIFALLALVLALLVNSTVLNPQFTKQKVLSQQITQQHVLMSALQEEIQSKVKAQQVDPDAVNRARLETLKGQLHQAQGALKDMQKGLVPADKMTAMLEDILRQNGRLRLVSMKTMPAVSLNDAIDNANKPLDPAATAVKDKVQNKKKDESIYMHGVELVVEGGYLDMMNYMSSLEKMPWQLFWSKVKLNVDEYPKATLTLSLFTLSLDQKWMDM